MILADVFDDLKALGWAEITIQFLVNKASKHLYITVDVGLVVGMIPATIPSGSA